MKKRIMLLVAEVAGVASAVAGIAMWSTPAALVAAGVATVIAVEVRS